MGEGRKLEVGSGNGGQDRNEGGQKNVGRNWERGERRIAFWLIGTWNSNRTIYLYWSRIWVKKIATKGVTGAIEVSFYSSEDGEHFGSRFRDFGGHFRQVLVDSALRVHHAKTPWCTQPALRIKHILFEVWRQVGCLGLSRKPGHVESIFGHCWWLVVLRLNG